MSHLYKVRVEGYVFCELAPDTPDAEVKAEAQRLAEDGELDIVKTEIEAAFND